MLEPTVLKLMTGSASSISLVEDAVVIVGFPASVPLLERFGKEVSSKPLVLLVTKPVGSPAKEEAGSPASSVVGLVDSPESSPLIGTSGLDVLSVFPVCGVPSVAVKPPGFGEVPMEEAAPCEVLASSTVVGMFGCGVVSVFSPDI